MQLFLLVVELHGQKELLQELGKEMIKLNLTAQGLSAAKSEKALEGYAHRDTYNSATRFKWKIPSNESFKVKGAISNTFYQKKMYLFSKS